MEDPDHEEIESSFETIFKEMKGVKPYRKKRRKKSKMDHKRKGAKGRVSPVTSYVKSLGDYKITKEVADELGVSANYVRKLAKDDKLKAPSFVAPFGNSKIYLYTTEDVNELKAFIASQRVVFKRGDWDG